MNTDYYMLIFYVIVLLDTCTCYQPLKIHFMVMLRVRSTGGGIEKGNATFKNQSGIVIPSFKSEIM